MMPFEEPQEWDEEEGGEPHPSPSDVMFNAWRTLRGDTLRELRLRLAEDVLMDLASHAKGRRIRSDLRRNVEAIVTSIIANLLVLHRGPQGVGKLVVSRRHDAVSPYDRPGFRKLPAAIDSMNSLGLLQVFRFERHRKRTTVRAKGALLDAVLDPDVQLTDVVRASGEERIVLTARPARRWINRQRQPNVPLRYQDTAETRALRSEMEELNSFLSTQAITFRGIEQPAPSLYRQFTIMAEGDPPQFNRHGRVYGGFWMTLPEAEREHLRINGEPIADLDFSAMFPTLAYIKAGQTPPEGDPYAIPGLEHERKAAKAVLSALLSVRQRLSRMPPRLKEALPEGWTLERLRAAVAERHPVLVPYLEQDLAMELMFTESRILLQALIRLMRQGVPALPMHDGMMVPESKQLLGLSAMEIASVEVCGVLVRAVKK